MDGIAERRAYRRACNSLTCMPFKRKFYDEVDSRGMSAQELCKREDWSDFVFAPFGEDRAEAHFEWLIKLGVLRREVDGQGLTNRIRLTPFGSCVLTAWNGEIPRAGLRERIRENFRRHLLIA